MDNTLQYLNSEIPVVSVEVTGYAASPTPETALQPTGLAECELHDCALRGEKTPELLSAAAGMLQASEIAQRKRKSNRPGSLIFTKQAAESLGHLFHVKLSGGIAIPSPGLAGALVEGIASDIWAELRPLAAEGQVQGIDLPIGRIIFPPALEAGHYQERLMVSVPPF